MKDIQGPDNRIVLLLYKYINKEELNGEEKNELDTWLAQSSHNQSLLEEMMNETILHEEIKQYMEPDEDTMLLKLAQKREDQPEGAQLVSLTGRRWWRYAAAAVLFILLSAGAYFIFFNHKVKQDMAAAELAERSFNNDLAPGTEKAILTLADGTMVVLDSLSNGAIAQQGNTVVMKEDGLLAYNAANKNLSTEVLYNTITVPRGGEYRSLVLADGTKVWLNSLSSMRFPTAFIGKERIVEITGEAYFEVAKNKAMPFKVKANSMQVEVLGTHFNVNAYEDEAAIKTTLVEGLVKIVNDGKASFLKPGQQAILRLAQDEKKEIKVVDNADIDETLAWKNGLFRFQKVDIKTIMRQVGRWYDVDVAYENEVTETFSGTIPRNVTASKLFTMLELTGHVHFKIDGKKIVVLP